MICRLSEEYFVRASRAAICGSATANTVMRKLATNLRMVEVIDRGVLRDEFLGMSST